MHAGRTSGPSRPSGAVVANRSAWVAENPPPVPCPPLAGDRRVDVAVVGGGFTGVSTAWHLRQRFPGLGIALLEAATLASGASGRNGGQVLNWINGVHAEDPERLRRIHAATSAGIDVAETLSAAHAPGAFRRQGCLEVFTDTRRAEAAHRRAEHLAGLGIPAAFLPAGALRIGGARGALLDPLAGRLDGFRLLQAMRGALLTAGVEVYEHTPVRALQPGAPCRLATPGGAVQAATVVLATGVWTPALGVFRRGILPLHSHVLATGPLSAETWDAIGWGTWDGFSDDLDRIAYACRTPGGRLVFGGGGNPAYAYRFGGARTIDPDDARRASPFMERILLGYFPGLAGVPIEHRWTGLLDLTFDRACSMGSSHDGRVYHALGYSGHGIALALLAGRVLTDLYAGDHERWRDLPFYQKRLLPLPPEPLRWLGYQAWTRLTGRSPRRPPAR